MAEKLIA